MSGELGANKSICILATVVVCFAILWPGIFYPMLKGSLSNNDDTDRLKQERQMMYPKTESVHPAIKDRGRATPDFHKIPRVSPEHRVPQVSQNHFEIPSTAKRPPIPGMRPPMGAGMHTPVQSKGSGLLGILMPVYTIGIVVFFAYTIIRLMNKKQAENYPNNCPANETTEFRRAVYDNINRHKTPEKKPANLSNGMGPSSQFVVSAFSGLIEEMKRDFLSNESECPIINEDDKPRTEEKIDAGSKADGDANDIVEKLECSCEKLANSIDDESFECGNVNSDKCNGSVLVVALETLKNSQENVKEWKTSGRELELPNGSNFRNNEVTSECPSESIVLSAKVANDSRVSVTDTRNNNVDSLDGTVVESKITLSVICPLLAKEENDEDAMVEEVTFIKDSLYDEDDTVENAVGDNMDEEEGVVINDEDIMEVNEENDNDAMVEEVTFIKDNLYNEETDDTVENEVDDNMDEEEDVVNDEDNSQVKEENDGDAVVEEVTFIKDNLYNEGGTDGTVKNEVNDNMDEEEGVVVNDEDNTQVKEGNDDDAVVEEVAFIKDNLYDEGTDDIVKNEVDDNMDEKGGVVVNDVDNTQEDKNVNLETANGHLNGNHVTPQFKD